MASLASSSPNAQPKKGNNNNKKKLLVIPGKSAPVEIKAPPAQVTNGAVAGGTLEIEKKIKTVSKKLFQIAELKTKRDAGVKLELTQLSKIEGEPVLLAEVMTISFKPLTCCI